MDALEIISRLLVLFLSIAFFVFTAGSRDKLENELVSENRIRNNRVTNNSSRAHAQSHLLPIEMLQL